MVCRIGYYFRFIGRNLTLTAPVRVGQLLLSYEVEIIEVRILIRNITEAKIILRLGHTPQIAVRRPMLIIIAIRQADRWMFRYDVF